MATVGRFTLDTSTGVIMGPAKYMEERFPAFKQTLEAGRSSIVNSGYSPDIYTATLVAIQTDYAAWLGMERTLVGLKQ